MQKRQAARIRVNGIVQGGGFRPYIYRLAAQEHITGWVQNSSTGVVIEAEGKPGSIASFIHQIKQQPPPLAVTREIYSEPIANVGSAEYTVRRSSRQEQQLVMISPDVSICSDCRYELLDKNDHHYKHLFIKCTNCRSRYTIICDVPHDRHRTSKASFPMCPSCQAEYEDPINRRFHAQPNICPKCGSQMKLLDPNGQNVNHYIYQLLIKGKIIAIKGLRNVYLAAGVTNAQAVNDLRRRKKGECA